MRVTLVETEFIPPNDLLEPATLYVSEKYSTAVHLCPCGCETPIVTPLNLHGVDIGWDISIERRHRLDGSVYVANFSLHPSILNSALECCSHYFIRYGRFQLLPD